MKNVLRSDCDLKKKGGHLIRYHGLNFVFHAGLIPSSKIKNIKYISSKFRYKILICVNHFKIFVELHVFYMHTVIQRIACHTHLNSFLFNNGKAVITIGRNNMQTVHDSYG